MRSFVARQLQRARLFRSVCFAMCAGTANILLATEPAPDHDTPREILSAAQATCESLRIGHFTMTGVLQAPRRGTRVGNPNEQEAQRVGQSQHARIKRRFECWFDIENDLIRIDLAPEEYGADDPESLSVASHGFQLVVTRNRIQHIRDSILGHGSRVVHEQQFFNSSLVFHPQSIPSITMMQVKGERLKDDANAMLTPNEIYSKGPFLNHYVTKLSTQSTVVVFARVIFGNDADLAQEVEWEFERRARLLPRKRVFRVIDSHDQCVYESGQSVEWTEQDGQYVPVRLTVHDDPGIGVRNSVRTGDFDLNWVSINEPIDRVVFDLVSEAADGGAVHTIVDLDTGEQVDRRVPKEDVHSERYNQRLKEVRAVRNWSMIGVVFVSVSIFAGVLWLFRRSRS